MCSLDARTRSELVDALLLSAPFHSFPETSCSPAFRRKWHSAYTAVEDGRQDRERLESYLVQLLPKEGWLVFPLDSTSWPHPAARTMPDRQYVHSGSDTGLGSPVIVGHSYSVLAWAPDRPLWVAYQPPPDQQPGDQPLVRLWRSYEHHWPVEPGTRLRKEYLCWTLPRFQDADACDR
jgi:hypothetical protein